MHYFMKLKGIGQIMKQWGKRNMKLECGLNRKDEDVSEEVILEKNLFIKGAFGEIPQH